jgi:hypothetical protein
MDALKDIPDNVNVLKTEKGDARLQKTDIFKKTMWFSYPNEESWIPLAIDRVKEIQQQNREGVIPVDLGEIVEIEPSKAVAKILDYENVVGQDSLTRLDDRRNKKKNKSRNKNQKGNQQRDGQQPSVQQQQPKQQQQQSKPQQAGPREQPRQQEPGANAAEARAEGGNKNRNKRFRGNKNKKNRSDGPGNSQDKGGQQDKQ